MSSARDYRKFLSEDGALDTRLLPRHVYTALVNDYRQRESVIEEVFQAFYLAWDLEQALESQAGRGEPQTVAAAAREVMDRLEDEEWRRVMAAFEERFIREFGQHAHEWAETLDPVYDAHEARGWDRSHA